jgi:hypothetical protein
MGGWVVMVTGVGNNRAVSTAPQPRNVPAAGRAHAPPSTEIAPLLSQPLPGMPSPAGPAFGQASLPGLEFLAADDRVTGDRELAAVAAELRALDGDGARMATAIRGGAIPENLSPRSPEGLLLTCADILGTLSEKR